MSTWNEVIEKLQDTKDMGYSHEELIEEIKDDFWGYTFRGENEVIIKFVSREPNLKWSNEVVECYTYHAHVNHEHAPIAIITIEKGKAAWGDDEYSIERVESNEPYIDFKKEHAKVRTFSDVVVLSLSPGVRCVQDDYHGENLLEALEGAACDQRFDDEEFEAEGLGTFDGANMTVTATPAEIVTWLCGSNYTVQLTDYDTDITFDVFNLSIDWDAETFTIDSFNDETETAMIEYYQNN